MSQNLTNIFKHSETEPFTTSIIGEFGEAEALRYLRKHKFQIVATNFKVPVGRNRRGVLVTGEIDIIALEKNVLCFIEVKTRSSDKFASPESAVNLRKQRQIIRTARVYRKTFSLNNSKIRYDAVSVLLNGKKAPKIELFRDFWTEEKFKKKYWSDEF